MSNMITDINKLDEFIDKLVRIYYSSGGQVRHYEGLLIYAKSREDHNLFIKLRINYGENNESARMVIRKNFKGFEPIDGETEIKKAEYSAEMKEMIYAP